MLGSSKMGRGKSRQALKLVPVSTGDVDLGGGAAPGPTALERVSLVLGAARRHKWIAAVVFLVGLDASAVYHRLKPAVYRVEAIVAQRRQEPPSVRPEADAPMPSAGEWVHERENLLALIDEANLLGPQATRLASADLPDPLRRRLSELHRDSAADSGPTAALIRRLDQALEVTTGDGVVTVAIEWPDAEQAYRVVKVALKRLTERAGERFDGVVKPAEVPSRPVSPDPLRVFGIGALASLLLAVVVAAAFDLRSGRTVQGGHGENGASRRARPVESAPAAQVAIDRRTARHVGSDDHLQELWFTLARRSWKSLVLVPGDEGESAAAIAASLVSVGRRLRRGPVIFFIIADPIDYDSAARIMAALEAKEQGASEQATTPTGQVIATILPLMAEPLGLAITEAADVAIVCAEAGRTRLAAARRTIDLIGRERIAGCLVLHPTGASSANAPSSRAPVPPEAPRHEIQQMWMSLMRGDWSSLVVIPTDGGIPARDVVGALHEAAAHVIGRFQVIDAVGVSIDVGERLAREMATAVASGTRVVAAVDSPMQSPSGFHLVRGAQAALLVVRLGSSNLEYVRTTVELVGRERILGAVTLPR